MSKYINPYIHKASNLILTALLVHLIGYVLLGSYHSNIGDWVSLLFPVLFAIISVILIRRGYGWMKWVYAIITAYFFFDVVAGFIYILQIAGYVSYLIVLIEYILRITAIVILFKARKEPLVNLVE